MVACLGGVLQSEVLQELDERLLISLGHIGQLPFIVFASLHQEIVDVLVGSRHDLPLAFLHSQSADLSLLDVPADHLLWHPFSVWLEGCLIAESKASSIVLVLEDGTDLILVVVFLLDQVLVIVEEGL